ncbi:ArdC-like ssDNA-binding domain-containing protein [Intestinibacillus massiliensis]|uniref:ArdC-like ssDNA-binding domain-containing protein n=1 Tax=Intestinibacillus massiliensis TaxID=1871029 RepID=UPI000B35CC9E|nr:ArdC-like ssDNA-binding domain-containing protein [Intestinibacillus massiliensis]
MSQAMDERVAELTDKLENGIKELYASGRYAEYLRVMSKFHQYSIGNVMLIYLQCPHATHVAGYGTWKKEFGRQVKRYETGINILAPCPYKRLVEQEQTDPDGEQQTDTRMVKIMRFRVTTVFDVSQTEGRELPTLGVDELTGDVSGFSEIYDRLAKTSPVPVEQGEVPGVAKGYFSAREQKIVLRSGMSQVQTVKTLVHEIAHALLHDPKNLPKERKERRHKEIEAESVAYVVCQHFGIETSDYSFAYVAGWSKGKELKELKASLDTIRTAASQIINAIQPPEREAPEAVHHRKNVLSH